MGNAGSMDQHADFRGHNMPLKLPMPEPGELEERFATVLVREEKAGFFFSFSSVLSLCSPPPSFPPSPLLRVSWDGTAVCVGWTSLFVLHGCPLLFGQRKKGYSGKKKKKRADVRTRSCVFSNSYQRCD